MALLVTDLDGKNLDSPMGRTQEITVPLDVLGTYSFVFPGQQYKYSNNRSIVVAAVLDQFSTFAGNVTVTMGSASSVAVIGDWLGLTPVSPILNFALIYPFGGPFYLTGGPTSPVYASDTFDFSIRIVTTSFIPAGATCRAYLIGVAY